MLPPNLPQISPGGHRWKVLPGNPPVVDVFAFESDYHNGPECLACGLVFCEHCDRDGEDYLSVCPEADNHNYNHNDNHNDDDEEDDNQTSTDNRTELGTTAGDAQRRGGLPSYPCKAPCGCENKARHASGLCSPHRKQLQTRGTLEALTPIGFKDFKCVDCGGPVTRFNSRCARCTSRVSSARKRARALPRSWNDPKPETPARNTKTRRGNRDADSSMAFLNALPDSTIEQRERAMDTLRATGNEDLADVLGLLDLCS